jgi:2-methylcitrate dehydratase
VTQAVLAARLARYAIGLPAGDLPDEVVARVRQRIVDSLACALGAYGAAPVAAAVALAGSVPVPASTVLGTSLRTSPDLAAFANGVMVRFLDYNDGYMAREPGHPSDSIPACLALAEAHSRPGRELIAAVVVAYEVQMRLQEAAALHTRGWDHVNYVNVAVAVAAARLLRLDQTRAEHAVNLALSGHVAMRQVRTGALSDWKGCSAANAARNAVFAAQLAAYGMTGPAPVFEGDAGFFAQLTGPFDLDVDNFGSSADGEFAIMRSLTKTFPTNGELHTAVWAALGLRPHIARTDDIARILIETSAFNRRVLADPEKWRPVTRETADHSLPYNVARALIDGDINLGTYSPEKIGDPRARALMDKTTVEEDAGLTALFPRYLANRVTVTLRSGQRLSNQVDTGPGSVEHPMTDADFERKFRRMAHPHIPVRAQDAALEFVATLDEQTGYADLFRALERPVR